jgi:hypothetical protein
MDRIETFDKIMDTTEWFNKFKENLDQKFEENELVKTEDGFKLKILDVSHKLTHFNQTLIDILDCFDGNFKIGKTRFFEGVFEIEGIL